MRCVASCQPPSPLVCLLTANGSRLTAHASRLAARHQRPFPRTQIFIASINRLCPRAKRCDTLSRSRHSVLRKEADRRIKVDVGTHRKYTQHPQPQKNMHALLRLQPYCNKNRRLCSTRRQCVEVGVDELGGSVSGNGLLRP